MQTKKNNKNLSKKKKSNDGLSKESKIINEKIDLLATIIGTLKLAENIFLYITSGINNQGFRLTHLNTAIKILKYHYEHKLGEESQNLFAFQNSLVEYFESVKRNGKLPAQLAGITKKIYSYFLSTNYFIQGDDSKKFNIFDICPQNRNDVTTQLKLALSSTCPNNEILNATQLFIRSKNVEKNYLRVFVSAFKQFPRQL